MNVRSTLLLRVLGCGLVLSLASCSTQMYSGSRLPKEQVARIKENSKEFMSVYFVTLWEVNGRRVHDSTFGIDVPPGRTRVTVLVHSPPTSSNTVGYRKVSRTFTAKAGYVYTLDGAGGKLSIRGELNESVVDKMKKKSGEE